MAIARVRCSNCGWFGDFDVHETSGADCPRCGDQLARQAPSNARRIDAPPARETSLRVAGVVAVVVAGLSMMLSPLIGALLLVCALLVMLLERVEHLRRLIAWLAERER